MTLWGYVKGDVWKKDAWLVSYMGEERPAMEWLREYINTPHPPQPPVLVSPVGTEDEPLETTFVWEPSTNATSYHFQLSTSSSFNSILIDTILTETTFTSDSLELNSVYYWYVSAINENGESEYSDIAAFVTLYIETAIDDNNIAINFYLNQNYPNPFNPTTNISFELSKKSDVKLTVYDMVGNSVAILAEGKFEVGTHKIQFDGSKLSTGVYFYQLESGDNIATKKMILMK
jgi:hypothetical protein